MDFKHKENSCKDEARRKTAILSAEDLFHWRKKEVLPVPQRGGIKDFEPDGSWLQDKCLETFCEEHLTVLAEPRVEKSGHLVQGTWDSEMKLVNIEKTAKFWMKMGFAHRDHNWLHPEEALFLMEVNCLDVVHNGVSLSLQEAYGLLLHSSCNISEEEYQVFAHLRRLGYIVLRHAGKLDITSYEMKIGLHNYTKKKSKKRFVKSRCTQNQRPETSQQMDSSQSGSGHQRQDNDFAGSNSGKSSSGGNEMNGEHVAEKASGASRKSTRSDSLSTVNCVVSSEDARGEKQSGKNTLENVECERSQGENQEHERQPDEKERDGADGERLSEDNHKGSETAESSLTTQTGSKRTDDTKDSVNRDSTSQQPPKKKAKLDSVRGSNSSSSSSSTLSPELKAWCEATDRSFSTPSCASLTEWDFRSLHFPDIAGMDTVSLCIPPARCLPPNTCVEEEYEDVCMFDVEEYRQQQQHSSSAMDHVDNSRHLKQLEFSYAEWHKKNFHPLTAKNWREWKEEFGRREKSFLQDSPVAHLWQGAVTPLVQPAHAHSTDSLLKRLSVIQPFHGPFPAKKDRHEMVKISFDVYLPNTTFRKSCPGLPDHRVCVARGSQPPDVFEVHAATADLDDGVALHWAVVSSGDICFFVFEDLHLPVHPSTLG